MVTKFKNHLAKTNLAKNTVTSYVWTVQYVLCHYGEVNKKLFKAIEVPIPPYNEQQRIVEAINKAFMSLNLIMESL